MSRIGRLSLMILAAMTLTAARNALGQISGCVDSPEDPTIVLAIVGLGAAAVPLAASRVRSRRKAK